MSKSIVFDLGGTLMEYVGMPLNWSDYYTCGFKKVNDILRLNLSENDLQESVNKLISYNPRTNKREHEIKPEIIFNAVISNWEEKPDINKVIEIFFEGLNLRTNIYGYSIELLKKCRNLEIKTACLTDLPNGMPDYIFKPAIKEMLSYFDLYVSSQICGVRKPNKGGICYIAEIFGIREAEILFVGDEEKDFFTAQNAGCDFTYISDFLKNEKFIINRDKPYLQINLMRTFFREGRYYIIVPANLIYHLYPICLDLYIIICIVICGCTLLWRQRTNAQM